MPTGGFIGFSPTSRSSGNAGANSIFLSPMVAPQNGTATAVLIDAPSATSSISFKALVYDGSHSALLATGSAVASIGANYNRLPLTANLGVVAGTTYYVGYACSASCPVTTQSTAGSSWLVSGGQSVASPANPLVGGAINANTLMVALELDGTGSSGFGFGLDQSSAVTLSASNTVATLAGLSAGARSVLTHLSGDGKLYAEVAISGTLSVGSGIGIAATAWGTNQGSGSSRAYVYLLLPSGSQLSGTNLGLSYVSGDVIGIAYDGTNNFMWWNKNNGSWFGASSTAGNPVTPSGGLAVQTAWPMALSIAGPAAGSTGAYTLRDTAGALQYSPPAGYSAWSTATYPAVATTSQARVMVMA